MLLFTAGDHTVVSSQSISIHIYIFVCLAVIFELLLRDLESTMFTQTSVWPLYPSYYPFASNLDDQMCVYFIKNECVRKTLSPAVRKQRKRYAGRGCHYCHTAC